MTKALISVTGLDSTGIIARVATKLSEIELQPVRDELKMTIHMQRMDIFDAMHRI